MKEINYTFDEIFDSSIENEYLMLYKSGALDAEQLNAIRKQGLNGNRKN